MFWKISSLQHISRRAWHIGLGLSVTLCLVLLFSPIATAQYGYIREPHYEAKWLATDSDTENDQFGKSIDMYGNVAVVGAPFAEHNGVRTGAAYVFTRSGPIVGDGSWTQQAKLVAADGAADDQFGHSVGISGDTIVVGAVGGDAAYIFTGSGAAWSQQAKLTATDTAAGDGFGSSVAIYSPSDPTVIIGAPLNAQGGVASGAAYLFTRSGTDWSELTKLVPADVADGDQFGASVELSYQRAIVGAPLHDANGVDAGAAYYYEFDDIAWHQQEKFMAADGAANDRFGASVAVDEVSSLINAVIGAPSDDDNGTDSGSIYIFRVDRAEDPDVWFQFQKRAPQSLSENDQFGHDVDMSVIDIVVGTAGNAGAAYYLANLDNGLGWGNGTRLERGESVSDSYGTAVASSGYITVGAPLDAENGSGSGAFHSFWLTPPPTAISLESVAATTNRLPLAVAGVLIAGALSLCLLLFGRNRPQMLQRDVSRRR